MTQRHKQEIQASTEPSRAALSWLLSSLTLCLALMSASSAVAEPEVQTLQRQLAALQERYTIPVIAVNIQRRDSPPLAFVLGAKSSTPMRWGSITKTITALTVLALHHNDQLDLAAPLANYVDASYWHNPWQKTNPITVHHLLELRAGFADLSRLEFDYNEPMSLAQAFALDPAAHKVLWPPGLQHAYSNFTPGLTQLLIEEVTGVPYAAAAKDLVFAPLGMTAAGFAPNPTLPGGFKADGKTPIPYWHMTFPAFGALNANILDMQKLLAALMGRGPLPTTSTNYLLSPHTRSIAPNFAFDYAAGFYPRVRRGHVWHTHGGDADGYRSRIAFLAGHKLGYVVNINVDNARALRDIERLIEGFLGDGFARPVQSVAPIPTAPSFRALDEMVGTYYPSSVRFGIPAWRAGDLPTATIQLIEGHLQFRYKGQTTELIQVNQGQFRRSSDPVATVVFAEQTTDEGTYLYLQGELGNFVHTGNCPPFLVSVALCIH